MRIKFKDVRTVRINGDFIKLDALLKFVSSAGTGGEAKLAIQNGEIFVNGEICLQRGKKIKIGDIVRRGNDVFIVKQAEK